MNSTCVRTGDRRRRLLRTLPLPPTTKLVGLAALRCSPWCIPPLLTAMSAVSERTIAEVHKVAAKALREHLVNSVGVSSAHLLSAQELTKKINVHVVIAAIEKLTETEAVQRVVDEAFEAAQHTADATLAKDMQEGEGAAQSAELLQQEMQKARKLQKLERELKERGADDTQRTTHSRCC